MKKIFQEIWKLALPYQDKRNDEGHAETVLSFAKKLIKLEKIDENVIIPAAILHDIGWSRIPKEESLKIFNEKISDEERIKIQKKHEAEGIKLAKHILEKTNYNPKSISKILEIISRHDTGKGFLSKSEGMVRDADKLWRYSKKGFWADMKRRNDSAENEHERLKIKINSSDFFYSENAKKIAKKELEKRKSEFSKIRKDGRNMISRKRRREPLGGTLGSARKPSVSGSAENSVFVRSPKGQVKIDFIFALVFFTAIIFYIGVQINGAMTSNLADSKLDALKSEAESVLDVLASTEGVPKNWEALPDDNVVRIGLAHIPYNLSSAKVASLNNRCALMEKFGSISYRLSITAGGSVLLSCGYGGPRVTSRAERPVLVNGNYGKMTLEMW